jgi:hypothetical protein
VKVKSISGWLCLLCNYITMIHSKKNIKFKGYYMLILSVNLLMMCILCPAVLLYLYDMCNMHKYRPGLTAFTCWLSWNLVAPNFWEPYGPVQACNGIALPYLYLTCLSLFVQPFVCLSERFIWRTVEFVIKAVAVGTIVFSCVIYCNV